MKVWPEVEPLMNKELGEKSLGLDQQQTKTNQAMDKTVSHQ